MCVSKKKIKSIKKSFPNVMFAILNCIGDASRDHGSPSPPPWHLAPSKGGGCGNGIKGMVQNRPTIYRVINWEKEEDLWREEMSFRNDRKAKVDFVLRRESGSKLKAWLKPATAENVSPHVKWHSYTYIQVPLYMRTTNLLYTDFIGNFDFRSPQKGNLHFSDPKNFTSASHYFLIRNPFLTLSQYFFV